MRHVVIGAGPAGVIASETLRKLDPTADIKLIGDEPEPPYSRMALPYLLTDNINEAGTYLRKADQYFENENIHIVKDRVSSVASDTKTIKLDKGGEVAFDKLLIATGSHPVSPPIPGIDSKGVHSCWTMEDARNIIRLAQPGSDVVLMGAGFIGCIILEALAGRKVNLTVVEMENRMVPRMMNEESGNLIKKWCEAKGVKVYTSTKVTAVNGDSGKSSGGFFKKLFAGSSDSSSNRLAVELDNGTVIPADLVISATGVKSNVGFLDGSGVKTNLGVMVDDYLMTNVDGIYAAGDVAQAKDFSTGEYTVQAIQPTAADHARIAAANMTEGQEIISPGTVNMNVLSTMGLISTSFGKWDGADGGQSGEIRDIDNYRYLCLQFADDVLVGANSLGMTNHIGILRGLIQSELHLGKWKDRLMNNPLLINEAYLSATQGLGLNSKSM